MIAFSYYLLKVIICSGLLYSYYYLALRNKLFHIWNRFYLLAAIVISLTVPLIKIQIWQEPETQQSGIISLLNVVSAGDQYIHEIGKQPAYQFSTKQFIIMGYLLICLFMLSILVRTILQINRLIRHHPIQAFEDFYFINTAAKGTPFSFLKFIFWNNQIEPDSEAGQQMLKHELAHVREKHSHDKIFINLVLLVFWSNPFFWLIRREMGMIHEFIADKKSVDQSDTRAFAAMILQSVYPQHQFSITNNFFHSPLKRRLLMLTKIQNPHTSYISRLLVLPFVAFLITAFTLKVKQQNTETGSIQALDKPFMLVIDAGHGGDDGGAIGADGTMEKVLNLAIAKKIKALNQNKNIKIILTREKDIFQNVEEKTNLTAQLNPDAFISIHIASAPPEKTSNGDRANRAGGFEVYVSSQKPENKIHSAFLGTLIVDEIKNIYPVNAELKTRKGKPIWVLDAPTVNYPAVMIECGYITNNEDLAFIKGEKNQERIARNILDAVQRFVVSIDTVIASPDRLTKVNSSPNGAADTLIDIIEYRNTKKNLEFRKKAAAYLHISEKEIQKIHFERIEHGGATIKLATVVTLKDKTTKEISGEDSKKIGIQIPASPPRHGGAKVRYITEVEQQN